MGFRLCCLVSVYSSWVVHDDSDNCGHTHVPSSHSIFSVAESMRLPADEMVPCGRNADSSTQECCSWKPQQEEIECASNRELRGPGKRIVARSLKACKQLVYGALFFYDISGEFVYRDWDPRWHVSF